MRYGEGTLQELLTPVAEVLRHPDTTEIVIQKPGEVGVEQNGKWSWLEVPEFQFADLDAIGLVAGRLLSKRFDPAHPIVETTLLLPGVPPCRYTAIRPPITPVGCISVTVRKPRRHVEALEGTAAPSGRPAREDPVDAELLSLYREKRWPAFYALGVRARKAIGAVGAQKSGKTHFIRQIARHVDPEDRVVTVEDTDEFLEFPVGPTRTPLRNRVSLIYGAAGVTAERTILTSLRMAADRVAIQELRGDEAYAFLRICLSGQTGSFVTWHGTPDDPFASLETMIRSHPAGSQYQAGELKRLLRSLVDIVVYCQRDPETKEFLDPVPVYFRLADDQDSAVRRVA